MSANIQSVHTQRTVPLHELMLEHKLWSNPREFTGLSSDALGKVGASIKENGIIDPPMVKRIIVNEKAGLIANLVIDGQRRILAAREVLPRDYPVPVVDFDNEPPVELTPDLADKLLLVSLATLEREGLSSFELSQIATRMKDRGKTLEYIGKAIQRDPSWVSKILTARKTATPKLMSQWKKGEITDEQFKELASVKEPEKQAEAVKEVTDARKSGDKGEARIRAKEIVERAKADAKPGKATINSTVGAKPRPPVVSGPQLDMYGQPIGDERPEPKADPKPKMRNRAVLDDFLHMFDQRPPTADYVKGIADAIRYVCGDIEADAFGKAWHQYTARALGVAKPAKKAKPKFGARAAKATSKAIKKAKAKPAKKAKRK